LCRAQDHPPDRGVSYGARFGEGFLASYPETTGYIIPTFLRLGRRLGDESWYRRATEMGRWEVEIQMDCGAVMGGRVDASPPSPAIFNTGQVLLGWARLIEHLQTDEFLAPAGRAARWMAEIQRPDGSWSDGNSAFADSSTTVYNVRAAWGLARIGRIAGEQAWIDAGARSADYAVAKQLPGGWFADCCLTDAENPLVHTLAYTARGLLELGTLLERPDFVDAARRCADGLMGRIDDGFLPGRFGRDFEPAARWCCLTGSAQTSIVLSKLFRMTGDESYRRAASRLNDYLMARHDVSSQDPTIRGGLAGSWPVHGDYAPFTVLNWATKFLIDALLEAEGDARPV